MGMIWRRILTKLLHHHLLHVEENGEILREIPQELDVSSSLLLAYHYCMRPRQSYNYSNWFARSYEDPYYPLALQIAIQNHLAPFLQGEISITKQEWRMILEIIQIVMKSARMSMQQNKNSIDSVGGVGD